jgi:hypothetical protein
MSWPRDPLNPHSYRARAAKTVSQRILAATAPGPPGPFGRRAVGSGVGGRLDELACGLAEHTVTGLREHVVEQVATRCAEAVWMGGEHGIDRLPEACPHPLAQVIDAKFLCLRGE